MSTIIGHDNKSDRVYLGKFIIHEAPSEFPHGELRYYLIHTQGKRRGLRVWVNDREWEALSSPISADECGLDKEYVFIRPVNNNDCDYSVRFYTEEGAAFFLHCAQRAEWTIENLEHELREFMPNIDRIYNENEIWA